jgi:hypothetical protein
MNTFPISKENKNHEFKHKKTILHNINYPSQTYLKITRMNKNRIPDTSQKQKYETFTYIGTETRIITNLFKNTNILIAYRSKSTIQNHLEPKNVTTDIYNKSGIYQMKSKDCQLKYIGQNR